MFIVFESLDGCGKTTQIQLNIANHSPKKRIINNST